jgi:S-methylmethionine-dependent homocysteine/selenocysteine methylase
MTALPHETDRLFVTDGGLETTLLFLDEMDLPEFAAFDLLKTDTGVAHLSGYYERYLDIARRHGLPYIFESATWRANPDWATKLGYDAAALEAANVRAIDMLKELQARWSDVASVISGCVGPRDDGYNPATIMSADDAQSYHGGQIGTYAAAGADLITAVTMTNVPEAVGVTRAASTAGLPVAISFTVETNGTLPTGDSLGTAIAAVDAATDDGPAYYMINCAHPTHFNFALEAPWMQRVRGLRANASCLSHAELDEAEELDAGNPEELGQQYAAIRARFPHINVVGGCCGTDHRHIASIVEACA